MNDIESKQQREEKERFIAWAIDFIRVHGKEAFRALMKNRVKVPVEFPMGAVFKAYGLEEKFEHRVVSRKGKIALANKGKIKKTLLAENHNKIMDVYKTAIIANNLGVANADQNLGIDYICIGTQNCQPGLGIEPGVSDPHLGKEFYRATPDEAYQSGSVLVIILVLDATRANPTNTTVATASSNTVLTVQAGQGTNYAPNDSIRVFTSTWEYVTVQSVSTDTLTLKGTGLSITPTAGMQVERGFGEVMLVCGQATSSPNTGTPVNHAALDFFKNPFTSIMVEVHLNYVTAP